MSDSAQGPGWWLASDGRWYPPESWPHRAPPPPPNWGADPHRYSEPPAGYWPPARLGQSVAIPDPVIGVPLAPWWKRLVAALIDSVILGVAGYAIEVPLLFLLGIHQILSLSPTQSQRVPPAFFESFIVAFLLIGVVMLLGSLLYYGLLAGSRRGQTIGMMAIGVAVRDATTAGPIGPRRGILRQLVATGLALALEIPYIIDCLAPLWDPRRQAWHDRAVGCLVVDLRP